jgi:hypothetical protein
MKAIRVVVTSMLAIVSTACAVVPPASAGVPAASASPAVSPGAAVAAGPSAAPSGLPAFQCVDQAGNGWPGPGTAQAITGVRLAAQAGYDRFVVEFPAAVPGYRVRQQAGGGATLDPSGLPVTLDGTAALIVSLNPASSNGSYAGPTDIRTPSGTLREARQLGDFEAVTTWGLGLSKAACFRAFTLTSPARLVIDVRTA